jgi:transposase-like protein
MTQNALPATLREAIRYFADEKVCLEFVAQLKWPQGPICPKCTSQNVGFLATRSVWKCKGCYKQFSVKVGTIFEDSPISLDKWLCAIWMIVNDKNGISSYEVARGLGVTQKTAWFMMHRIRLALQTGSFKLGGEVEVDETYIGGKARYQHPKKAGRRTHRGPSYGKAIVVGMLERGGRVKAKVVSHPTQSILQGEIRDHVQPGSIVYTDEWNSYRGLKPEYVHQVINHSEAYVKGNVHTNNIENYWSLLKRTIKGTYVSVEPFHLFRYLDEQAFRFNTRKSTDQARFINAVFTVGGKRVTWERLTGQTSQ